MKSKRKEALIALLFAVVRHYRKMSEPKHNLRFLMQINWADDRENRLDWVSSTVSDLFVRQAPEQQRSRASNSSKVYGSTICESSRNFGSSLSGQTDFPPTKVFTDHEYNNPINLGKGVAPGGRGSGENWRDQAAQACKERIAAAPHDCAIRARL